MERRDRLEAERPQGPASTIHPRTRHHAPRRTAPRSARARPTSHRAGLPASRSRSRQATRRASFVRGSASGLPTSSEASPPWPFDTPFDVAPGEQGPVELLKLVDGVGDGEQPPGVSRAPSRSSAPRGPPGRLAVAATGSRGRRRPGRDVGPARAARLWPRAWAVDRPARGRGRRRRFRGPAGGIRLDAGGGRGRGWTSTAPAPTSGLQRPGGPQRTAGRPPDRPAAAHGSSNGQAAAVPDAVQRAFEHRQPPVV